MRCSIRNSWITCCKVFPRSPWTAAGDFVTFVKNAFQRKEIEIPDSLDSYEKTLYSEEKKKTVKRQRGRVKDEKFSGR